MRDLLRGKATGRLNVRALVARSGLPDSLSSLVVRVTKGTRLWRLEKSEVAQELVVHFQDAVASGADVDTIRSRFGNEREAARLIRRAKKRQRPIGWKMWNRCLKTTGATMAILFAIYAFLFIRYHVGEPTVAHDYYVEITAAADAVPPGEAAWPHYVEAVLAKPTERDFPEILGDWPYIEPGDEAWESAVALHDAYAESLAEVRQASQYERMGSKIQAEMDPRLIAHWELEQDVLRAQNSVESQFLIGVLLPHLGEFRGFARALVFDLHRAAEAGDGERVKEDLLTIIAMGEHVREHPILISDLVGVALLSLEMRQLAWVLTEYPDVLSDDALIELAHRHATFSGGKIEIQLQGERAVFYDVVQRVYTDDGNGDGYITASGMKGLHMFMGGWNIQFEVLQSGKRAVVGPVVTTLIAGRKDLVEEYDRHMDAFEAAAGKELWEANLDELTARVEELDANLLSRTRYSPIIILMPAIQKAVEAVACARYERDAILVLLAVELHKRRTGAYPQSLNDISATLLPKRGIDPFSQQPFRYKLVDGRPLLYSVGVDRDDDGGRRPADNIYASFRWESAEMVKKLNEDKDWVEDHDGDWVIYPYVEPSQN